MMLAATLLAMATGQVPAACPLRPQWRSWQASDDVAPFRDVLSTGPRGLEWNASPVSDETAEQFLRYGSYMHPRPSLLLDTTAMDCAMVLHVELMVEATLGCAPDGCIVYLSPTGEKRDYRVRPRAQPPAPSTPRPPG